jgi:acyl-coenzyme A thioesterase PaaI-like protein
MTKTKDEIDAFVAQVLSAPAHVAHGLKVASIGDGEAAPEFEAGPAALGRHGGVLSMLLEPAADMHVQHMRPVRPGDRVLSFPRKRE